MRRCIKDGTEFFPMNCHSFRIKCQTDTLAIKCNSAQEAPNATPTKYLFPTRVCQVRVWIPSQRRCG
ncbi:hypothetical protein PSAB6_30361 [Paraburkholderia sabiae]|nr:hypothetical protein PSAB6_30361 [Paraburkholderia sabiae]